ncbi:Type I restriction-modification system methyltransferase subunit-like protein [uncultured Pleomorphomonas sp.]|uniref:Type I restriction-modification system methyltransferase subunit-like protein n=1 Tax=uncultured Pleomorphomonas sp. TaxID=442121 RepID=A0A212L204_9HYPH|nr:N-6 DNA methylase [uncultured Pleomorphomonas sp.]SCM71583.1 Type I restriction-modification system methyltransferase subunit-like protein [uncultured Pleomorphomonas sp.]
MLVDDDTLRILDSSRFDGAKMFLPGQLDRPAYAKVVKVIEAAGGKWNRKASAHLFDGDAAEAIEPILLTGEVTRTKQEFGQFDTPPELADQLVELADLHPGMKVYEPSAGVGNIVAAVIRKLESGAGIFGCEIDPKRHAECVRRNYSAFGAGGLDLWDFLAIEPNPVFDRLIMNPPFARQADIDHVLHAYGFLKPGGRLVAIMSASVSFRDNKKTIAFREFVGGCNGTIELLPDGAFRSSGTDVKTAVVVLNSPD